MQTHAMVQRLRRVRRETLTGIWLPLGLVGLAFILRIGGLTAQSLWRDEVDALIFAARPLPELLTMFRQPGQNGPLFFLMLRPWLAVAGRSEFALRFPSVLAGTLAVPIVYILVRRLTGDRRPALVTALLMATAPYLIWYGQEAKMYAALTALAPAALLLTVEIARRGGWWRWALLYIITSLSFYTHLLAALVVPVTALWLLILPAAPVAGEAGTGPLDNPGRRARVHRGLAVVGYLAALILPYLPLLRWQLPMWQAPTHGTGFSFVPLSGILLVLGVAFSRGVLPVMQPITLLPYMLAMVAGAGLWVSGRRRGPGASPVGPGRAVVLLSLWLLLPPLALYGISFTVPVFTDRYLIWTMPAFLALAGSGAVALARVWRPLGLATLAAMLALNLVSAGAQTGQPIKSDFRAAAQYVVANRQPDDLLVYQIPYIRYTFAYYASTRSDPNDLAFHGLDGLYTNNGMGEGEAADRMAAGTTGARAAWLIASETPMWDARGLTEQWLVAHGAVTHRAEFARVSVTRYELEK